MQVRDLIEQLQKFDPSAEVEVSSSEEKIHCSMCGISNHVSMKGGISEVKYAPTQYRVQIVAE